MKPLDEEQIEAVKAAWLRVYPGAISNPPALKSLLSILQEPEWTPKVGQIVMATGRLIPAVGSDSERTYPCQVEKVTEDSLIFTSGGFWDIHKTRAATATEIGLEPFTNPPSIQLSIVQQEGYDIATRDHNKSLFGGEE